VGAAVPTAGTARRRLRRADRRFHAHPSGYCLVPDWKTSVAYITCISLSLSLETTGMAYALLAGLPPIYGAPLPGGVICTVPLCDDRLRPLLWSRANDGLRNIRYSSYFCFFPPSFPLQFPEVYSGTSRELSMGPSAMIALTVPSALASKDVTLSEYEEWASAYLLLHPFDTHGV
jgi:hypothetical protein